MKDKEKFSLKRRILSFRYAWKGMTDLIKYEHNFRIHIGAAIFAIVLSALFGVTSSEWCAVIIVIVLVLMSESFNTAIEILCDKISLHYDPLIGRIKDISAAGTMVVSIGALIVGIIVFIPYILKIFQSWIEGE